MVIKKAQKLEKKSFFGVEIPTISAKAYLYSSSADDLIGRIVTLDLTRTLRGRSFELKSRVRKNEDVLIGDPVSLALAASYIRRMIRKGTDYVEDSFGVECRDCEALVKIFIITRNKVPRSIRKNIRNLTRDYLSSQFKIKTGKEIITSIMTNKLQKELSGKLKKIYPLALCEIRFFEIVKEKKN